MIVKKYACPTVISFGARLSRGIKRINFEANTKSGSTYITDDEDIQNAIENHPYFKQHIIKLVSIREIITEDNEENTVSNASIPIEKVIITTGEKKVDKKREVRVSGQEDAIEFLSSEFGISRTQLRKTENIKKYAEANGIVFIGI